LAIFKNDIVLIAGSGDFAYEAANFLNNKGRLNHIILLSKNYKISKLYKNNISLFDIRDIENLIIFLKKRFISKVLIIGYVQLPPISEIKLSLSSKLILSKNFFLNDINNQSKILKKFIEYKKIKLISQKIIFDNFLIDIFRSIFKKRAFKNTSKCFKKYLINKKNIFPQYISIFYNGWGSNNYY
jgi:DUF1009 family protein